MDQNNRTEGRLDAGQNATATLLGNPDVSLACFVQNVSRSGMCIVVARKFPTKGVVKVEWDDHFLVGRIRRVDPAGTGSRVGLELLYCSKWSDSMHSVLASL